MENINPKSSKSVAEVEWGFDASSLETTNASDRGAEIEIKDKFGKPTGLLWTVFGKDGEIFRDIMRDRANERISKESMAARTGNEVEEQTAQQREADAIELLTACSGGWRMVKRDKSGEIIAQKPTMTYKGEELPFNVPNAMRVLTEVLVIRRQVDTAVGDLTLFTGA